MYSSDNTVILNAANVSTTNVISESNNYIIDHNGSHNSVHNYSNTQSTQSTQSQSEDNESDRDQTFSNESIISSRTKRERKYDRGPNINPHINPIINPPRPDGMTFPFLSPNLPLVDGNPYFLHDNRVIGFNRPRYTVNHININSADRNKHTVSKIRCSVRLDIDPMSFNGSFLKINIPDTDQFRINDKIIINGVAERELTIRSVVSDDFGNDVNYFMTEEEKQYMTINADNNMQIDTRFTSGLKDSLTDLAVDFKGFIGDKKTEWYFDTRIFKWEFIQSTIPISNSLEDKHVRILRITEDVLGVTRDSCKHSEKKQIKAYMVVAEFVIDLYGTVIEIIHGSDKINGIQYVSNDIFWTDPKSSSKKDTNPQDISTHSAEGIPNDYYAESACALILAGLNVIPTVPTTIYKAMEYFDKIQNTVRPIFLRHMMKVPNFALRYAEANKSYPTSVRLIVPEATKVSNTTMIGNISLSLLNSQHKMYLTRSSIERDIGNHINNVAIADTPSPNKFYIKLNNPYAKKRFEFSNPFMSGALLIKVYDESVSDVTIKYKHYGGVPINLINTDHQSDYQSNPLIVNTINRFKYIHNIIKQDIVKVSDIVKNSYIIVELDRVGYFNKKFGGDNVYISLVDDVCSGYPNPNNYVINLEKIYTNIVMIRMIGSCFPKSQNLIMNGLTGGKRNNRFYWQNMDDGDTVYSIAIDPGNYTPNEFKHAFEKEISKVRRISDGVPSRFINHIEMDINNESQKVTLVSYNEYISNNEKVLVKYTKLSTINKEFTRSSTVDPENEYYHYPIGNYFKIFPIINTDCDLIRIKIYHPNNRVNVNDKIIIINSLNFGHIPARYINGSHIVTRVTSNYYDILLSNINLDTTLDDTIMGGNALTIYTPNMIRVRFDYQDTFGKILGFRNVGECTSITPYSSVITNNTLYENEKMCLSTKDVSIHGPLQFESPQYILMTCCQIPPSSNSNSSGPIKDYFYRINMCGLQNTNVYNSYVKSPVCLNDPLERLSELNLSFYAPDGSYYDFNGRDHSFNLEIVTYDEIPEGTCINSS